MFLIVTRNFPPDIGGMQILMGGLSESLLDHGPVKVFADEFKNIKRQNIILNEIENLKNLGFDKIILSGWSAGGWSSLILQSKHPDKILGTIAFNPAFAGPKNEWQKKFPEWGAFRELQINELNKANTINAIVFAHKDDVFEDPQTLSFFANFNLSGVNPKYS